MSKNLSFLLRIPAENHDASRQWQRITPMVMLHRANQTDVLSK